MGGAREYGLQTLADIGRLAVNDPAPACHLTNNPEEDDARYMIAALQTRFPNIVGPPRRISATLRKPAERCAEAVTASGYGVDYR